MVGSRSGKVAGVGGERAAESLGQGVQGKHISWLGDRLLVMLQVLKQRT